MAFFSSAIIALLFVAVRASTFLGAHPHVQMESMPAQEVKQMLLSELFELHSDGRVHYFEKELRNLYAVMPKNSQGKLDPAVVRYALHRHFSHNYGWHLRGLEPGLSAGNISSNTIMKDRAPAYIQSLLEETMHGQGFGLTELAVFAATLADLIRQESIFGMESVFSAMEIPTSAKLAPDAADHLVKMYLTTYIKGAHVKQNTSDDFRRLEGSLIDNCIIWFEAKTWVLDMRRSLDFAHSASRNPFVMDYDFDKTATVAQEIGHRFGHFQNLECQALKEQLVDMEHEGSGRVTLSKFYSGIEDRDWPFIESAAYLRNLGALDETDPNRPSVIIPNFLSSPSNCVAPSSFYSVCCIDECESLLAQVEYRIGEPLATPARLADVVSAVESDTVAAPRNLSSSQLARLGEIATYHGGHVPLHGRLFAQWMHHAYPRECRFPHESGTISPLNQDEFTELFGDAEATDEEVLHHVNKSAVPLEGKAFVLPWTASEELIAPHTGHAVLGDEPSSSSSIRVLVLLAVVASAALPLVRSSRHLGSIAGDKQERYLV